MAGKAKTIDYFINKSTIHHNDKYNYDRSVYINADTLIEIFCNDCQEYFWQKAKNHMSGHGHEKCNNKQQTKSKALFIQESKQTHGDNFNYDLVEYRNCKLSIQLQCNICKLVFDTTPDLHLNKKTGCPGCLPQKIRESLTLTTEEFIYRSKLIYKDMLDYDKVDYKHSHEYVILTCKKHGDFLQTPMGHFKGNGCKYCNCRISLGQIMVYNFVSEIYNNVILEDNVSYKSLQLDILVPDKNLVIEYNGVYWHSINSGRPLNHLHKKVKDCQEHNLRVLNIYEDEWINSRPQMEQIIKNALGLITEKVFARKCTIWSITTDSEYWNSHIKSFFNKYHHQGLNYKPNGIAYCLIYNKEIVACAYFGNTRYHSQNNCELIRYATKADIKVVGGLSKLVKNFMRCNPSVKMITSYCDIRFFTGEGYIKAGFKFIRQTSRGFDIIKNVNSKLVRFHRSTLKKNILLEKYPELDKSLTQKEIGISLNWWIVPNCGLKVFQYFR